MRVAAIAHREPLTATRLNGSLALGLGECSLTAFAPRVAGTEIHRLACAYGTSRGNRGDVILEFGTERGRIAVGRGVDRLRKNWLLTAIPR